MKLHVRMHGSGLDWPLATPNVMHVHHRTNNSYMQPLLSRYSSGEDSEPKCYPEKKGEAHYMRFEEVKHWKGYTTRYGPPFKRSNHPWNIMVSADT